MCQVCPGGASRTVLSMSAAADRLWTMGMTPSLIQMVKYLRLVVFICCQIHTKLGFYTYL